MVNITPAALRPARPAVADSAAHSDPSADPSRAVYGTDAPDPRAVRAALDTAHQTIAVQDDPALRDALTPAELAAEREQAQRHRADNRHQDDRDHQTALRDRDARRSLARTDVRRQRAHEARIRRAQQRHEHATQAAQRRRERVLDPAADLVRLHHGLRILPALALVPAGIATAAGSINVGGQILRVTGYDAPAATVLAYMVEILFTLPLLVILATQYAAATRTSGPVRGHTERFAAAEALLLAVTVALNVGVHWLPSADGSPADGASALMWVLVPGGLAVSMWLTPRVLDLLTSRFRQSARDAELRDPAGSLAVDDGRLARLTKWVAEQDRTEAIPGERDPETGLPSASGVMRAVKAEFGQCSKPQARQIVDLYAIMYQQ